MGIKDTLIPLSDLLDLLQVLVYDENSTFDKLLAQIEIDLKSECKPTNNLKALKYFMMYKEHCKSSHNICVKILKSCISFLQCASDKDTMHLSIIGTILDICLSSVDSNSIDQVSALLLDFIETQYDIYLVSRSNSFEVNSSLVHSLIVLGKYCTLKIAIEDNCLSTETLEFPKGIGNEITSLICGLPLDSSKNIFLPTLQKFVSSQNNNVFLEGLWARIESLPDSNEYLDKQLFFLCLLSDNFITLMPSSTSYPLFERPLFWNILQKGLINNNYFNRKFSLHLLKLYYAVFLDSNISFVSNLFVWNDEIKFNLIDFWNQLFILFEVLEEKQVHLITPTLKNFHNLYTLCQTTSNACYSWLLCVFQLVISHSSPTLVKWGLQEFCSLDTGLLFTDHKCKILLSSFFKSLNNMFLFEINSNSSSDNLQNSLVKWFVSISKCVINESAFETMLDNLVNSSWSPIPLYFIVESLSKVPEISLLNTRSLNFTRKILLDILKTQSVFIRSATQSRLLKCITQLSKVPVETDIILSILGNFNGKESLLRGSGMWGICVDWLKKSTLPQANVELINLCSSYIFDGNISPFSLHSCARCLILFLDANILQFDEHFTHFSSSIFEQFEECDKRAYASPIVQDKCLELIMYIIDENNMSLNSTNENQFIKSIKKNVNSLLKYIQVRLSHDTITSLESVKLYESFLELIFLHISLLEGTDFIVLYKISFDVLKSECATFFQEYLSIKIILLINECILNHRLNRQIYAKTFEENIVEYILKKRLFSNDSLSYCTLEPGQPHLKGKLISEYMRNIWSIFYIYVRSSTGSINSIHDLFGSTFLMEAAQIAVCRDGKQALVPILKSFSLLLYINEDIASGLDFVEKSWTACFELRKSELFWLTIAEWIAMVYNEKIILKKEYHGLIKKYSQEIFESGDELTGLVSILMDKLSNIDVPLELSFIISNGLTFGTITKKDRRIEYEVCNYIMQLTEEGLLESFGEWRSVRNDKEVRLKALDILLNTKDVEHRNKLILSVVNDLLEYDVSISKNYKRYFNDSLIHRRKNRILQAVLILENYIFLNSSSVFEGLPEKIFDWIFESLQGPNQQPSVRYQLEWLFVRLCTHYLSFLNKFWQLFEKAGDERVGSLCSFMAIAYHLAVILDDSVFLNDCFKNIIPWCMSQNFNLRLYSQVVLSKLWDLNPNLSQDYNFIKKNQWKVCDQGNVLVNAKKMQSDFYFNIFHPEHHFSLQTIYYDLPRLSKLSSEEWIHSEILRKYHKLLGNPLNKSEKVPSLESCLSPTWVSKITDVKNDLSSSSIQKKFIPVKGMLVELEKPTKQTSGVILVASLIDKAANLGGLARTSEVFAVKELVIPNLEITKDREFSGLSMTAEKHLHITEVKPYNLLEYLKMMKAQGYFVVGLEQTTGSASLASFTFPTDCIILLGNEREGIPANIIPFLDYCIEIPQLGLIRSLNVHVSGAFCLWEYAKQHSFKMSSQVLT